jgi:DNA-directed RNA polymerase specialized sigma24 family protein
LYLRFWEDKSTRQIAQSEGCSSRTVDRALQNALESLQERMLEEMDAK